MQLLYLGLIIAIAFCTDLNKGRYFKRVACDRESSGGVVVWALASHKCGLG